VENQCEFQRGRFKEGMLVDMARISTP